MDIAEELIKHLALDVIRQDTFFYRHHQVCLSGKWKKNPCLIWLVSEYMGQDVMNISFETSAFVKTRFGFIPPRARKGKLIALILKFRLKKRLSAHFLCDFPKEISPLAKGKTRNPLLPFLGTFFCRW